MILGRRSLTSAGAVLVLFVSGGQVLAQPLPDADQPPVVFRAGIDLVRLDVRVTDANGRPVTDLRRDELEVVEDGRARPILLFQHVAEPDGSVAEVAQRTVASEVSTNRGAPRGHLYVVVFDQHHITPGNEQRARHAIERFLQQHIRPGDRVALYVLSGPGPQLAFTRDLTRVAEALLQVRGSLERSGVGVLGTMTTHEAYQIARGNQYMLSRVAARLGEGGVSTDSLRAGRGSGSASTDSEAFARIVREDARTMVATADQEARQFLARLADLMRELRVIEGRKSVVLLSEGFYIDGVARELEQAAAAAAESYSLIYALDLNRRADMAAEERPIGGEHQSDIENRLEPLAALALETDGRLVANASGRLDAALDGVAIESQDYYVLGFEPSASARKHPDRYHRVRVSTSRPGVRVSTRTGYSLASKSTPVDRRRAIDLALGAPFPQHGLPIEFTTYVLRGASHGQERVVLSLTADLPVVPLPGTGGADVVFVVRRADDGRVVASGSDVIPLPRNPRTGSTTGRGTYRVQFDVPAGRHLMRVVVREPGGLIGSADRYFDVRPLTTRDLTASDLIFGTEADGLPVRPAAESGSTLEGLVELYAPSVIELDDVDVTVDLFPLGQRSPVTSVRAELLRIQQTGAGASRVARVDFPLGGIEPGAYVARATVRAGRETVTELLREIEVLPASAPTGTSGPPDPLLVLEGEIVRRVLEAIRADSGPELQSGASLALAADWKGVEKSVAAVGSSSAPADILRGLACIARRDFAGSVSALERAAELSPDDARAAFFLGWAYSGAGDDLQAIGAWRNAARLDPTLVPAHLALADTFIRLAEPGLALQAVRFGLSVLPWAPELLDRLARLER